MAKTPAATAMWIRSLNERFPQFVADIIGQHIVRPSPIKMKTGLINQGTIVIAKKVAACLRLGLSSNETAVAAGE